MDTAGRIMAANSERVVSTVSPLPFDRTECVRLAAGIYMITYNEIVHLPKNLMALGRPRSSLLRCGVNVGTAVWDAGYEGRSQSLLMVHNPQGFVLQKNARVTQLVFLTLTGESEGYQGVYQGENI
jgi:dUTP pyrophosphatase